MKAEWSWKYSSLERFLSLYREEIPEVSNEKEETE